MKVNKNQLKFSAAFLNVEIFLLQYKVCNIDFS